MVEAGIVIQITFYIYYYYLLYYFFEYSPNNLSIISIGWIVDFKMYYNDNIIVTIFWELSSYLLVIINQLLIKYHSIKV